MIAPDVVEFSETIWAPFCAALRETIGAATWVCGGVIGLDALAPPQPQMKSTTNEIGTDFFLQTCMQSPQSAAEFLAANKPF